jgi:hypothetical protein
MPVVHVKSGLIRSPHDGLKDVDPILTAGKYLVAQDTVANGASDSSGSTYLLAYLPSDCILMPATSFLVSATGFVAVRIGTYDDVDALVAAAKADAATQSPIAFGGAFHGKRLWETLGLAKDPGGLIPLYQHAIANATGAGTMKFAFHYLIR